MDYNKKNMIKTNNNKNFYLENENLKKKLCFLMEEERIIKMKLSVLFIL